MTFPKPKPRTFNLASANGQKLEASGYVESYTDETGTIVYAVHKDSAGRWTVSHYATGLRMFPGDRGGRPPNTKRDVREGFLERFSVALFGNGRVRVQDIEKNAKGHATINDPEPFKPTVVVHEPRQMELFA